MEGDMDRSLSREKEPMEDYDYIEKFKIGIIAISRGGGVSFLGLCMARALANTKSCRPTVVELGNRSLYDSMGMDKRFAGREFFPFYVSLSEGRPIKGRSNMDEGINWVIGSPEENHIHLNIPEKLMLTSSAKGNVVLCDFSSNWNTEEDKNSNLRLLQDMDHILVVIDPLPSKMLGGYDFLQEIKSLEAEERPVTYIINKFNNGVNKKEMLGFLKIKKPIFIPFISAEEIYKAEYNCKNPYSIMEVKKQLQDSLREIFERVGWQL